MVLFIEDHMSISQVGSNQELPNMDKEGSVVCGNAKNQRSFAEVNNSKEADSSPEKPSPMMMASYSSSVDSTEPINTEDAFDALNEKYNKLEEDMKNGVYDRPDSSDSIDDILEKMNKYRQE